MLLWAAAPWEYAEGPAGAARYDDIASLGCELHTSCCVVMYREGVCLWLRNG